MADELELDIDSIIKRLLSGKAIPQLGYRASISFPTGVGKTRNVRNVQLKVHEVQGLCMKSREIFLSQPTLLELEAPITICGKLTWLVVWVWFCYSSKQ